MEKLLICKIIPLVVNIAETKIQPSDSRSCPVIFSIDQQNFRFCRSQCPTKISSEKY